jgi:hypothetical protein
MTDRPITAGEVQNAVTNVSTACVHFVGFTDDRYWNAVRVFGLPDFIHCRWDKRAVREIDSIDLVIFANGEWMQEPSKINGDDIREPQCP